MIAGELIDRLASASRLLSFAPVTGWLEPYALGFLWRHIFLAHEMARHQAMLSWLIPVALPNDQQRQLFLAVIPTRLALDVEELGTACDRIFAALSDSGPDDPFSIGVAEADRILHRVEGGGGSLKDQHTRRIEDLERRFRQLPGRHPISKLIGLVLPSKFYPYLVAHTLGRSAFAQEPDDAKLSRLLGFS
jgi:hypothetical protein